MHLIVVYYFVWCMCSDMVCIAAGLAAEYLILGSVSASAGNHDFRSVIDSAKEQLTSEVSTATAVLV
jgi:hypothetical protein